MKASRSLASGIRAMGAVAGGAIGVVIAGAAGTAVGAVGSGDRLLCSSLGARGGLARAAGSVLFGGQDCSCMGTLQGAWRSGGWRRSAAR